VLVSGLLLLIALAAVRHWLAELQRRPPDEVRLTLAITLRCSGLAAGVIGAGFGLYLFALGRRAVRAERFPPPGVAVIRDTPVLTGVQARRRGAFIQTIATVLVILACALAVVTFRLATRLSLVSG
jgi:hypothetical protein